MIQSIVAAAATAVAVAVLLAVMPWLVVHPAALLKQPLNWSPAVIRGATGFFGVLLLGCLNGLLARMTYIELSHMRPCRPAEALRGFFPVGFRLVIAYFLIIAVGGLIAALLRSLPTAVAGTVTD